MYTLFYSPHACSLASHIALAESGLPYEVRRVNFAENEQRSAEYLKHNPNGRVPALVTERGTLIENPAILAFVAQAAPLARLAPLDDPIEFARMQGFNSFIASSLHVAYAHNKRGYRWADGQEALEAMKRKVVPNMHMYFGMVENDFLKGPWVLGEAYSVADAYLFTMSEWLEGLGIDINEFPRVADHFRRMNERPAVRQAIAAERPGD